MGTGDLQAIFGNFKVIHKTMKEIAYNAIWRSGIWEFGSLVYTTIVIRVTGTLETSRDGTYDL